MGRYVLHGAGCLLKNQLLSLSLLSTVALQLAEINLGCLRLALILGFIRFQLKQQLQISKSLQPATCNLQNTPARAAQGSISHCGYSLDCHDVFITPIVGYLKKARKMRVAVANFLEGLC